MAVDFAIELPLVRPGRPRYPVLVHKAAALLHASFRPRLATTPLRFANPSPPSGWIKDFHLQTTDHARHTLCGAARRALHRVRDTSGICARRRQVICPSGGLSTGVSSPISDFPKNISVFTHPKSSLELTSSSPQRGVSRSSRTRGGMRWTRQRWRAMGSQGRFKSL
jgi:hypothetical protein